MDCKSKFLFCFLILPILSFSQATEHWNRTFKSDQDAEVTAVLYTPDNEILIGGKATSDSSFDKSSPNYGSFDMWLIKTDANGAKKWDISFGGSSYDELTSVILTSDNKFLIAGTSESSKSGNKTIEPQFGTGIGDEVWLIKMDYYGKQLWQKNFGGPNMGLVNSKLVEAEDGGFIIISTLSYGSAPSGNITSTSKGGMDIVVIKVDKDGNKIWDKTFGGSADEQSFKVIKTYDGNYLIGAMSNSDISGDKSQNSWGGTITGGSYDYWLLKIDKDGNKLWDKRYGAYQDQRLSDVIETSDKGLLMSGWAYFGSSGGNMVTPPTSSYSLDIWVVKVDSLGNFQWDNRYANQNGSGAGGLGELPNKQYVVTGSEFGMEKLKVIITDSIGNTKSRQYLGNKNFYSAVSFNNQNEAVFGLKSSFSVSKYDYRIEKICLHSNCSFVSGSAYNDINRNCQRDSGEVGIPNMMIEINPGPLYLTTNETGDFFSGLENGNYIIKSILSNLNSSYVGSCQSDNSKSIILNNNSIDSIQFPKVRIPYKDFRVSIATERMRPGFESKLVIEYANTGTITKDSRIILTADSKINIISTVPTFTSNTGNVYEWDHSSLSSDSLFRIAINCYLPTDFTLVGKYITNIVTIEDVVDDNIPENNFDTSFTKVINSFDPNEKLVFPEGEQVDHLIDQKDSLLTYEIHFQNTGSDTAFKVVVTDTLSSLVDIQSLRLGASSHNYTFSIFGNKILKWTFDNIQLIPKDLNELESEGFIKYYIKQKNNNPGEKINNTANIYFDFNPKIGTKTVFNTIAYPNQLGIKNSYSSSEFIIYPNPFNEIVNIVNLKSNNEFQIVIKDMIGCTVMQLIGVGNTSIIDVENLPQGIYFIEILGGEKKQTFKVVKY